MGYFGCLGQGASVLFWVLLWLGRDKLWPRWTLILIALWVGGRWLAFRLMPFSGSSLALVISAVLDIVLVLVVFEGDLRLT